MMPSPDPKPGVSFIDKEDVNQSNIQIVGLGIDRHNPDVPALAVMNEILGGGFASRLVQKVRTELGPGLCGGGGIWASPTTIRERVRRGRAHQERIHRGGNKGRAGRDRNDLTSTPFTADELARGKDNHPQLLPLPL
jgi:hypothetical protein